MTWYRDSVRRIQGRASVVVRRAVGLSGDPPTRCNDPREAYGDVHGVARIVHADLPSMLIGGLGSLFFQMLHPYAMAGVAQHSRYQDNPLGRLRQTADFIGATTFGSQEAARAAIERVLNVHRRVHGVADDGQPYDAYDPHLLRWVHCAEIYMFLNAYRRFGARRLSGADADRYVAELAPLASDLGVLSPPTSVAELDEALLGYRGELRLCAEGVVARDFIAHGVMRGRGRRLVYWLFVRSAWSLLPPWASDLLGVRSRPVGERLVIRPMTRLVSAAFHLAVPPPPQVISVSPPSSATT